MDFLKNCFLFFLILFVSFLSINTCPVDKNEKLGVFGGNTSLVHQFPYQVAIYLHKHLDRGYSFCGGSVISKNLILTTARCFTAHNISTINILFGAVNISNSETTSKFITQRVTKNNVFVHENFSRDDGFQNDIALIKLSENLTFSEAIYPIRLADEGDTQDYVGQSGNITGWGREHELYKTLNYVSVRVMSNKECRANDTEFAKISNTQLCTAGDTMLGICDGDYGGPFVVNGTQIGIQSYYNEEPGACFFSLPSVYTKVASFRQWIREKSGF